VHTPFVRKRIWLFHVYLVFRSDSGACCTHLCGVFHCFFHETVRHVTNSGIACVELSNSRLDAVLYLVRPCNLFFGRFGLCKRRTIHRVVSKQLAGDLLMMVGFRQTATFCSRSVCTWAWEETLLYDGVFCDGSD
jgi:hypothetical protein